MEKETRPTEAFISGVTNFFGNIHLGSLNHRGDYLRRWYDFRGANILRGNLILVRLPFRGTLSMSIGLSVTATPGITMSRMLSATPLYLSRNASAHRATAQKNDKERQLQQQSCVTNTSRNQPSSVPHWRSPTSPPQHQQKTRSVGGWRPCSVGPRHRTEVQEM